MCSLHRRPTLGPWNLQSVALLSPPLLQVRPWAANCPAAWEPQMVNDPGLGLVQGTGSGVAAGQVLDSSPHSLPQLAVCPGAGKVSLCCLVIHNRKVAVPPTPPPGGIVGRIRWGVPPSPPPPPCGAWRGISQRGWGLPQVRLLSQLKPRLQKRQPAPITTRATHTTSTCPR